MNEYAIIAGSVSEEVFIYKPFFAQAPIMINISGPNGLFQKNHSIP